MRRSASSSHGRSSVVAGATSPQRVARAARRGRSGSRSSSAGGSPVRAVTSTPRNVTPSRAAEALRFLTRRTPSRTSAQTGSEAGGRADTPLAALCELMFEPGSTVLRMMLLGQDAGRRSEPEGLAGAIVRLFELNGRSPALFQLVADIEMVSVPDRPTYFRGNDLPSRLVTSYATMLGKGYLKETLSPLIEQVVLIDKPLELDPNEAETYDQAVADATRFQKLAALMIRRLGQTMDQCPVSLRRLVHTMQQRMQSSHHRGSGSKLADEMQQGRTLVSTIMFLRFIGPALTAPEQHGLMDEAPCTAARTVLINLAKLLQSLGNGHVIASGALAVLEPWMRSMLPVVARWCDRLVQPAAFNVAETPRDQTEFYELADAPSSATLQAWLREHKAAVASALAQAEDSENLVPLLKRALEPVKAARMESVMMQVPGTSRSSSRTTSSTSRASHQSAGSSSRHVPGRKSSRTPKASGRSGTPRPQRMS